VGTERDPGFKTEATVNKKFPIPQDNPPRERKMHKAICADCGASCEVPFVPKPDRPVYCKTCFTGRKKDNNAKNVPSREEIVAEISRTLNIDMDAAPKAPQGKTEKASRGAAAKKGKAKRSKGRK
ncbi:MAG TPA: hypothetical protein PKZ41_06010, partial [Candidatus Omnitrophota bacterium]|nr:hypothetical protein [Candidatus Omnitrophota bacterium]